MVLRTAETRRQSATFFGAHQIPPDNFQHIFRAQPYLIIPEAQDAVTARFTHTCPFSIVATGVHVLAAIDLHHQHRRQSHQPKGAVLLGGLSMAPTHAVAPLE